MIGPDRHADTLDLLRLTLTPGLGPVLIARLLARFGSAADACRAGSATLQTIEGIGPLKSARIAKGLGESEPLALREWALAESLGVRVVPKSDPEYPTLLAGIPDPPPLLYVRGRLRPEDADRYPVAIVGSRSCSHYGLEQSKRFAGMLARSGLTIISGGARGIDSAAHRGALESQGRTVAVLGCGLAHCYPPENADLFGQIAAAGAVVSELPLNTTPTKENFPARNRIIAGLSLGVLVVEAGRGSGALITARQAVEEHGREVMALPGRVDSEHSQGSNDLIKAGEAALVTEPGDVIAQLESAAHHQFRGTHAARYTPGASSAEAPPTPSTPPSPSPPPGSTESADPSSGLFAADGSILNGPQQSILDALAEPRTLDDLAERLTMDAATLRTHVTTLELQRRIVREGGLLRRASPTKAVGSRRK